MNKKSVVVPEGMLKAGMSARNASFMGDEKIVRDILEAALLWLSENPIVPTDKQVEDMLFGMRGLENLGRIALLTGATLWQRRMFLDPEPEVPEEIKDLQRICRFGDKANRELMVVIAEAFRRGQKSPVRS